MEGTARDFMEEAERAQFNQPLLSPPATSASSVLLTAAGELSGRQGLHTASAQWQEAGKASVF